MGQDPGKPVLYDYFRSSADVLLADYKRSKIQKAASNLGSNRELFQKHFLSKILPPRLSFGDGEIWDSQGNQTGQLDLVILRDDATSLDFGGSDTYLAEGVFAVIEIKSNLTTVKLDEALRTLRSVRSLKLGGEPPATSGPVLNRALRCIFAYEGATFDTLSQELAKEENTGIADLVSVLDRGCLIADGLLVKGNTDSAYFVSRGKAASLGWLYYHLVSYSTSFIARSLNMDPYFEPATGWNDP